jgi:hypothetical protein
MQIRTTLRFYLIPVRISVQENKKQMLARMKRAGKETLYTVGEKVN